MSVNHDHDFPMSLTFANFVDERPIRRACKKKGGADNKTNAQLQKTLTEIQTTQMVILNLLNKILTDQHQPQNNQPEKQNSTTDIAPGDHQRSVGLTKGDLNGS